MEELKGHSSKWIKTKGDNFKNFYWQNGYGAFSVNPSEIEKVIHYIDNQHEHHRNKSYEEEYVSSTGNFAIVYSIFLKKYKVKYDERYIWD